MTPVGHAAVSYLGSRALKLPLLPFLVGGLAPDIDFVLLPLSNFNELHRVATHSLLFVTMVGILCAIFAKEKPATFLAALLGGLLHLLADSMLDTNASNGIGVAALWPFSSRAFSVVNFAHAQCDMGWSKPGSMLWCGLAALLWELPFVILAGVMLVKNDWLGRRGGGAA